MLLIILILNFKSANYECEQRTNKARTTRELRANYERELTRERTTRRARLPHPPYGLIETVFRVYEVACCLGQF